MALIALLKPDTVCTRLVRRLSGLFVLLYLSKFHINTEESKERVGKLGSHEVNTL